MKDLKSMIKTLMIVLLCALVFSQVASPVAYAAETYENYLGLV